MMELFLASGTFLLTVVLWSCLKIRSWYYRKHGWSIWKYEDAIFLFGLITTLTLHSMIFNSIFTSTLSLAPWTIVGVKIYQMRWRKTT
jgi:hypothetical protein